MASVANQCNLLSAWAEANNVSMIVFRVWVSMSILRPWGPRCKSITRVGDRLCWVSHPVPLFVVVLSSNTRYEHWYKIHASWSRRNRSSLSSLVCPYVPLLSNIVEWVYSHVRFFTCTSHPLRFDAQSFEFLFQKHAVDECYNQRYDEHVTFLIPIPRQERKRSIYESNISPIL